MKPKSYTFISIIIISLISGIPLGILPLYSNSTNQDNISLTNNIFEVWRNTPLDRNNMEPENFINLTPELISSISHQINKYVNWLNGFYSTEEMN